MAKLSFKAFFIFLAIIVGAVFLNKYIAKEELIFYPKSLINLGSYLFTKSENFSGNDKLKRNQELVFSLQAKIDNLENENDFLRRTARISQRFNYPIVYAGIFNINLTPNGYNVLLNKGVQDGISESDVVITAEGVLVGKIQKVMENFSRVLFISDPQFKITAKVINSGTTGIVRGALGEGLYLDFIVQEDEIKEEDMLISTGSDLFPPALVVGSVDYIETNATKMFKKVRIRPAIKVTQLSRVLVIKIK